MTSTRSLLTLLACVGALTGAALAEPPTEAEIQAAFDDFETIRSEVTSFEEYQERLAAFEAAHPSVLDLSELDAATIERLTPVMFSTPERGEAAIARLQELEHPKTTDGAIALINGTFFSMMATRQLPELGRVKVITAHPALGEAIASGHAEVFFTMLGFLGQYKADELREIKDRVAGFDRLISDEMDADNALAATGLLDAWNAILDGSEEDAATRERVRVKIASALRSARAAVTNEEMALALDEAIARTDGAYARGELVGHEAPDIEFLWSSNVDQTGTSLSALKGKVVVLDFWATWCGPCLQSIPNIRSLQSYYQDSDVVILGVTSLQGFHTDSTQGRVDTTGDPEKEFSLMAGFIQDRNITWPVVFGAQDVFNPEYGVEGIPHMVIIDAEGKVRHRALHPGASINEKIAKIDPLLVEAGLELPAISKSALTPSDPHGDGDHDDHEGHDHP
jgi:thiol-disulfide isomerase/thioredoxin